MSLGSWFDCLPLFSRMSVIFLPIEPGLTMVAISLVLRMTTLATPHSASRAAVLGVIMMLLGCVVVVYVESGSKGLAETSN